MEIAIDRLARVAEALARERSVRRAERRHRRVLYQESNEDDTESVFEEDEKDLETPLQQELLRIVRKELCPALRDLMQHGLALVRHRFCFL